MTRAVPAPDVFLDKKRIMGLYKQACRAFPQKDYIFNLKKNSKPMLGFIRFAVDVLILDRKTGNHQSIVTLPAFIADGTHVLTIEEYFEYELKFAGVR